MVEKFRGSGFDNSSRSTKFSDEKTLLMAMMKYGPSRIIFNTYIVQI